MESYSEFTETNWLIVAKNKFKSLPAFFIYDKKKIIEINYHEFSDLVKQTLFVLQAKGIKAKDFVPLHSLNDINSIKTIFALWLNGSIPVLINSNLTEAEQSNILSQFEFNTFLSHSHLPDLSILSSSQKMFIDDISLASDINNSLDINNFNLLDDALVIFTSGSSSIPKGVVHKFKSLLNSFKLGENYFKYSTDNKWLLSLPLFHIGGIQILIRALLSGGSVIIPKSMSTDDLKEAIEAQYPNFISLVSTQFKRLLEVKTKAPQINKVLLGGGKIETDLINEGIEQGWNPYKVYGSSETAAFISVLSPDDFKSNNNSAGRLLDGVKIEIIYDSEDKSSGEIIIESPTLFNRYLDNRNLTSSKLINGKYYSGDYGYLSGDFLFIVSRRSDLIISGGENINPHEIEEVILSNKAVKETCVVGIPDEEWGEIVCAVIVLKDEEKVTESEIKDFLKLYLTRYKIPKQIIFLKELPKTELGKIKRGEILSMLEKK